MGDASCPQLPCPFHPEYVMSKSWHAGPCMTELWSSSWHPKLWAFWHLTKWQLPAEPRTSVFQYWAHGGKEPEGTCLSLNSTVSWNATEVGLGLYLLFCMTFPAQIDHIRLRYSAERVTVLHEVHWEPLHGNIAVRMWAFVILIILLLSCSNNLSSTLPNFFR